MEDNINELRLQYHNELKRDGTVDNLKSQLRYKLLERLQLQQKKVITNQTAHEGLPKRVAASMVADFLKVCGLDYCLSVFTPECGYGGNLLEREELCVLLKTDVNQKGVLLQLCEEILMHKPRVAAKTNSATQTYTGDAVQNLEQRLSQVDNAFRTKIEEELIRPQQDLEERLLRQKRDLETRLKAEFQADLAKFKEFEAQDIRIQEAQKHKEKMQEYREELERNYQERLQKLRERERDVMEKAALKQKELEGLNYNYRQKIMKEQEILKMKEQELVREKEISDERIKLQQQKMDAKERELKRRIDDFEYEKMNTDQRYQNDIQMNKINLMNEMNEEQDALQKKKKQMEMDLLQLNQLKETVEHLKKENRILVKDNESFVEQIKELKMKRKDLEYELAQSKDQYRTLQDVQRRDLELARKYEHELKIKEEEINIHKRSSEHKETMLGDIRTANTETMRNVQRDIQQYKEKIEKLEEMNERLREQTIKRDNIQQSVVQQSIQVPTNVMESVMMEYNFKDHKHRLNLLHHEMEENRLKRQEEAKRLQQDWYSDRPAMHMKFQDTWDVHQSSVEFSQGPSLLRKPNIPVNQESYGSSSKVRRTEEDPMNIFKMDEAQSQVVQSGVFQKRGARNIIQESYDEGSPLD